VYFLFLREYSGLYIQYEGKSTWFFIQVGRNNFRSCGFVPDLHQPHITIMAAEEIGQRDCSVKK
jgi:hypothetical protein